MIPPPSLSLSSLKSTLIYHLIVPLVILFPALVLQPQPYFPAPKFLIHSEPPPTSLTSPSATLWPSSVPPDHALAIGQAWHISLYCHSQSAHTCQLTRTALERAGNRLAGVIRFRAPVVARVDLLATAQVGQGTLGWARPMGKGVPVKHVDDGLVYIYPRALVKQLPDMEGVDEWINKDLGRPAAEGGGNWDVEVEVNAGEEWWVEGAGMGEMLSHQYDLEYLLVHELIHSLGFGQDLVLHHPAPLPSRLSPAFDSHPLTDPSASFTRFSHPSIWNRFTQLNSTPLVTYKHVLDAAVADVIAQGELRPAPAPSSNLNVRYYRPADVYLALAGHVRGSRAMRDMYDLATTNGSLVFDTGAWPATPTPTATGTGTKAIRVELETGLVPFAKASSAGHIRIGGAGGGGHVNGTAMDQDGLMGWQLKRGVKVSSVGIGQRTRSVLGALGYTLMGQAWVTRRGVAKVDVDEVQRMRQDALAVESQRNMSCGGAGVRDAAAWAGAFGVVVAWIVHRGWV